MAAISQEVLARAIELQTQAKQQAAVDQQAAAAATAAEAERTRSNTWGEALGNVPAQALSGAVGLGQAAYGLANLGTLGTLDRVVGLSGNFQQTQQILADSQSGPTRQAAADVHRAFDQSIGTGVKEVLTNPAYLQQAILGTLPSLIPAAAGARLAGGAASAAALAEGLPAAAAAARVAQVTERAVLATTAGQVGGGTNVDSINAIRAAGGDENLQQAGGVVGGLIAGVAAPVIGKLTGAAKFEGQVANLLPGGARAAGLPGAGIVGSSLTGGLREGTEETAQSASEQLAQNIVTPGKNMWDGVGQQAAIGGVLGTLLGGGMGAAVGASAPRASSTTPLGTEVSSALADLNQAQGTPLTDSGLNSSVVANGLPLPTVTADSGPITHPTENIDLGATALPLPTADIGADTGPAPVENIDLGATPVPLRSLYDITGRQPYVNRPVAGLAQVEELAPTPRPGALGVIDAQRSRGQLGGSDLFAGQLPVEGAFPQAAAVDQAPTAVAAPAEQGALPFDAPVPTWKQQLSKELGLKPASFTGKVWKQFSDAAEAAGVRPGDAGHVEFLQSIAPVIGADKNSAPLFAAKLAEKYGAPAEAPAQSAPAAPEPVPVQEPPAEWDPTAQPVPLANPVEVLEQHVRDLQAATATHRENRDNDSGRATRLEELEVRRQLAEVKGQGTAALDKQIAKQRQYIAEIAQGRADEVAGAADVAQTVAQAEAPVATLQPATAGAPGLGQPVPLTIDQQIQRNRRLDPDSTPAENAAEVYGDLIVDAGDTEQLDQAFSAIKNHQGWAALSTAQQDDIVHNYELRYARLEDGGAARFDRSPESDVPRGTPLPIDQFQQLVAAANRNKPEGATLIIPVESVADFETRTGKPAPADARGVFDGGNVYLIRENLTSPEELASTLAHERGHQGLAALLGDRLPAIVNRLWTNPATRERIKSKMQALDRTATPSNGAARRLAAEEVLADMLASGEKVNGDVITKARAGIESVFATLLGVGKLRMTNTEVDRLLRDTAAVVQGQSPATLREGNPSHYRELVDMMADPIAQTAGEPRFSRISADMDKIVMAAESESSGTRRNISDVAVEAGQAAWARVKNLGTATTRDKILGGMLDAVPLNQTANLYSKLFDGGIATLARLKRGKESMHNKNLTAEQPLKYRDEEMRASANQVATEWAKFNTANPARKDALNHLQQNATLYRLWPDLPLDQQSPVDHTTVGFTAEERAAAHTDIRRLWNAVGPEGRAIYKKSQGVYTDLWTKQFKATADAITEATGIQQRITNPDGTTSVNPEFNAKYGSMIGSALKRMSTGPYSPLQRYGDYLVTVRAPDGKIAWFSGHDTIEQARLTQAELRNEFATADGYVTAQTLRTAHDWSSDGISQAVINQLKASVDGMVSEAADPALHKKILEGLTEAYLQSLPQGSFMQHANTRKNIRGATTDAFRAYNDYATKASRSIAGLTFDGKISSQLSALENQITTKAQGNVVAEDGTVTGPDADELTKMGRVLNAVKGQHAAAQKFERSPVADALTGAGFLWFLSSPSQLFINSLQTFMVTLPRLAAAYGNSSGIRGMKQALGAFAKSYGDLRGEKSTLDPAGAERRVMDELYTRGVLDFTLAHDMTGQARGDGGAMSGHWRKAMEVAGWAMHKSEVFNRQVTALAATKLEMAKQNLSSNGLTDAQISQLTDVAEEMVLTTQFDYSQSNKPPILQGPWRNVIGQFQMYRLNMLAMMGKDIRDSFTGTKEEKQSARRALSWMLGTQLALTGAAGTVLAPLAFAIADMFRDDDDLLDSRTEFLRSVPQWLSHGLLAGVIDTSRVGADGLLSVGGDYAPKDATAKDTFNYYLTANLGPAVGLGANIATGMSAALGGDHVKAVKNLAPAGIRDVYKAYFEGQQGAKDSRQVVYYEPGVWDTVTSAVGLRSGDRRDAEELRGASYEASTHANALKQRKLGMLALGYGLSDADMIATGQSNVADFNSRYPDMAIKASDIRRAVVQRVQSQRNADVFGIASPKPPSQSIREALGI